MGDGGADRCLFTGCFQGEGSSPQGGKNNCVFSYALVTFHHFAYAACSSGLTVFIFESLAPGIRCPTYRRYRVNVFVGLNHLYLKTHNKFLKQAVQK